jgi:hypothetical protein
MYIEPITDSEEESDDYGEETPTLLIDYVSLQRILGDE